MGIKDRQKRIKSLDVIRDYDLCDGPMKRLGKRSKISCKKLRLSWAKYVTKYSLCQIPGDFHIIPINRLVNFEQDMLYLKNEQLYLPQTQEQFPESSLFNCDEANDLSFLLVFYGMPENIDEFPVVYNHIRFFYASRRGNLDQLIVDPDEIVGREFRGTKGIFDYTPIISIEDALTRKI